MRLVVVQQFLSSKQGSEEPVELVESLQGVLVVANHQKMNSSQRLELKP